MSLREFTTQPDVETLATEVACLKATLTLILRAIGQVDAGKVVLNMEKLSSEIEDEQQTAIFKETLRQIKSGYLK
ncbi:DUF2594 family protein [Rouxiella sp. Mn2063]|uniref:DUF2594 family protein n=1 Tax=Rouxiella sp. Mn2063 TaxID=3395262 RepID=UPI003BBB7757